MSLTDSGNQKVDGAFDRAALASLFPPTTDVGFHECVTLYEASMAGLDIFLDTDILIELGRRAKEVGHNVSLFCSS
jgi:hypothetical protein